MFVRAAYGFLFGLAFFDVQVPFFHYAVLRFERFLQFEGVTTVNTGIFGFMTNRMLQMLIMKTTRTCHLAHGLQLYLWSGKKLTF